MEEKTAEGEPNGYIIRRVLKYAKEILKKLTIDILTVIMGLFVNFFYIANHPPISRASICSSKMNPSNSFPILRLPFLALEEVFKAMHPIEIINFSMTSKRAKAVTKNLSLNSKYAIRLYIDKTLDISFYGTNNLVSCTYVMTSDEEVDGKIVEKENNNYIRRGVYNYSKDPVNEWKQLCKYALEIFKMQTIDVLTLYMDASVDHNVSIIDFLRSTGTSVNNCNLYQQRYMKKMDEHTAYLLNIITINVNLVSLLDITNKNFHAKIPKNLNELYILYAQWFGYDKLLEIDCKSVVLRNDRITDEQWNLFFKKWIAIEIHSNLLYLELDYREIGSFRNYVLHDIPHEVVDGAVKRTFKTRCNATHKISGGIDIRRIDGKTATVFVYRTFQNQFLAMSVH